MESFETRLRPAAKQAGVMGRMEWFRDLKKIFNKISLGNSNAPSQSMSTIQVSQLVNEIRKREHKFTFIPADTYNAKSKQVGFTLEEVIQQISSFESSLIAWDEVIDSLIQLSVAKKKNPGAAPASKKLSPKQGSQKVPQVKIQATRDTLDEIVSPIASDLSSKNLEGIISPIPRLRSRKNSETNNELARELEARRNSEANNEQPPENSYRIEAFRKAQTNIELPPETSYKIEAYRQEPLPNLARELDLQGSISDVSSVQAKIDPFTQLEYLNLAGNMLERLVPLPRSLILLNLSNNNLSDLSTLTHLPNLQFINLNHNRLSKMHNIQRLTNLREAYFSDNSIRSVYSLCQLDNLTTLDLSFNEIQNFEDIATLAITRRLLVLKMTGNPLWGKPNYGDTLRQIMPKVQQFDPKVMKELSNFQTDLAFAAPKISRPSSTTQYYEDNTQEQLSAPERRQDPLLYQRQGELVFRQRKPETSTRKRQPVRPHVMTKSSSHNQSKVSPVRVRKQENVPVSDPVRTPERKSNRSSARSSKRGSISEAKYVPKLALQHSTFENEGSLTDRESKTDRDGSKEKENDNRSAGAKASYESAMQFIKEAERRISKPDKQAMVADAAKSFFVSPTQHSTSERSYGNPTSAMMIAPAIVSHVTPKSRQVPRQGSRQSQRNGSNRQGKSRFLNEVEASVKWSYGNLAKKRLS